MEGMRWAHTGCVPSATSGRNTANLTHIQKTQPFSYVNLKGIFVSQDWGELTKQPGERSQRGEWFWGRSTEQSRAPKTHLSRNRKSRVLSGTKWEPGPCNDTRETSQIQFSTEKRRGEQTREIPTPNTPLTSQSKLERGWNITQAQAVAVLGGINNGKVSHNTKVSYWQDLPCGTPALHIHLNISVQTCEWLKVSHTFFTVNGSP